MPKPWPRTRLEVFFKETIPRHFEEVLYKHHPNASPRQIGVALGLDSPEFADDYDDGTGDDGPDGEEE